MADANAYNALLGDYGDPSYWRTPMRQPNALYGGGPVWENNHAAPVTPKQRPADWAVTSGIAEAISPTMGAYGMGAGVGQTYNALSRGDYAGAAEAGLPLMAMALMPGFKGKAGELRPAMSESPRTIPALAGEQRAAQNSLLGTTVGVNNGLRAFHGSPNKFNAFNEDGPHWFATDEQTAAAFGRDRMGLPPHSLKKPNMYDANIGGKTLDVDPWAEAVKAAENGRIPKPETWDDVAQILQWAEWQKGILRDAQDTGHSAVRFKNVGDSPDGRTSDHVAVLDPASIRLNAINGNPLMQAADMEAVASGQGFGSKPKPSAGQTPQRPDGWPAWGDSNPDYGMAFVRERDLHKQVQPLIESVQYPGGMKAMERFEAERQLMADPKTAALLQDYHDAQLNLHRLKQGAFADVKLNPGDSLHDPYAFFNEPTAPGTALPTQPEVMAALRAGLQDQHGIAGQGQSRNALMAPEQPKGIRAYHGSPHDFDRFDISKIGTGEGAQAYGHGLYFAEQEATAKSYRNNLSGTDGAAYLVNGKPVSGKMETVLDAYRARGENWDAVRHDIDPAYLPELEYLQKQKVEIQTNGRMYEVQIKADPEHFLDWDKPLSQQSEKVRGAIEDVKSKAHSWPSWGDGQMKEALHLNYAPQELSSTLQKSGIPGIRYLDQGSRGAGEGSRNYVVFDPATIEILRKYGLLGPMAGGVGVNALYGSENQ